MHSESLFSAIKSKGNMTNFVNMWRCFVLVLLFSGSHMVSAQIVYLLNPSLEGEHRDAVVPMNWLPCEDGTTPDILPGPWGVYQEPSDGESYVGLITRENNTWESIGQRLKSPLEKDVCYQFSLDLAHSDTYSGYNNPIKLRIWGSRNKCDKDQLIHETEFIKNIEWEKHTIKFTAESNLRYILFEAFYRERPYAYKGNILIDDVSAISPCKRAILSPSDQPADLPFLRGF